MVFNPFDCQFSNVQGGVEIPCEEYAFVLILCGVSAICFAFRAFAFFTHKASVQLFVYPPMLDPIIGQLLRTIAAEL